MKSVKRIIEGRVSLGALWGLAIASFVISKWIQIEWLDKSYVASKFPVPFYKGQTTFDAAVTKAHYQVLVDEGTLSIFRQTQFIDFAYILATFLFTFLIMAAIYKNLHHSPKLQKFSWAMVLIMPLNCVMDIFENLISFIILMNPADFPDWLIIPYSSFATVKFALYGVGYIWIIIAGIFIVFPMLGQLAKSVFNKSISKSGVG